MLKNLTLLIFLLNPIFGAAQQLEEKEFVILTFEMERNKDSHGTFVYYWVAELEKYEKVDEYKEPIIYSIFLHEFYSKNQLDSCCLGKTSYPFYVFENDNYDFSENYSANLSDLRDMVKENRVELQVIKKEWKDNHKEIVTVYGTAVKGTLCECKYGGDRYLRNGEKISFPQGQFKPLEKYLSDEKWILLFKDFSRFEFTNTDYRTSK